MDVDGFRTSRFGVVISIRSMRCGKGVDNDQRVDLAPGPEMVMP